MGRSARRGTALLTASLAALALLLVACSGSSDDATPTEAPGDAPAATETPAPAATDAPGDGAGGDPTAAPTDEPAGLSITSAAFEEGGEIPFRYTCDGANILPPLEFAGLPDGTASLALVIDDPDAPGGTFDHFVRFNIAPVDGLEEGASAVNILGNVGTPGINGFGSLSYGGPCPPDGSHTYVFQLYALDSELTLAEGSTKDQLIAAMEGAILGSAELTGEYARKPALAAAEGLDPTAVIGRIGGAYKFVGGQGVQTTLEELRFEPGSVEAHWYQQDGSYVIVYRGLDAEFIGPLCPGNSIQTASGFLHVSNSPNEEGGCAATVPAPPAGVGVQACGEDLVYITAIPTTATGTLYGTIEWFDDSGALLGMTSVVATNAAATPAIDLPAFCGA